MTVVQIELRAKEFLSLWNLLLPRHRTEQLEQFALWASTYSDTAIKRGIQRAAHKLRTEPNRTLDELFRYANGVICNVENNRERQPDVQTHI